MGKIKSIFCLLATTLFFHTSEAMANELTRHNMDESSQMGTIIRHYFEDADIMCCNSTRPYFMLYQEGVSTSYALYVNIDTVTDFEIENGKVFFVENDTRQSEEARLWGISMQRLYTMHHPQTYTTSNCH